MNVGWSDQLLLLKLILFFEAIIYWEKRKIT